MKYFLYLTSLVLSMLFWAAPARAWFTCQGDPLCYMWTMSIVYAPPFFIITILTFVVIKFIKPSFPLGKEIMLSLFIGLMLTLFYHSFLSVWIEKIQITNSHKHVLSQMNYELYEPSYVPSGYQLSETRVPDNGYLYFVYRKGSERFILSEYIKPSSLSLNPPTCYVYGKDFEIRDRADFTTGTKGDCQEIKTLKGTSIYLMKYEITKPQNYALVVFDNTLITIARYNFSNQELINLIDGLQEKEAAEINIKILDRTIGR